MVFANLNFVVDFFDDADGTACIFGVGNGVDAAPPESDVIGSLLVIMEVSRWYVIRQCNFF